ncbi:epithelial-stromal interaction protein 1 [Chanos chanos]|uniref:Epithelial-stromal interaction protein 1 n=1 Tax=Chanos chanos TaxID=29144 RepID=A0A6J2WF86_CHACN|nr:epithelial-stromal interaction protein 1 [Chanos chanos]
MDGRQIVKYENKSSPNARINREASNYSANEQQTEDTNENLPEKHYSHPPRDSGGQSKYMDGYTMIPPNESRRSQLQRMAQQEEQMLERLRQERRPGPIRETPERLGGGISLAEVRQRQQLNLRQSKLQKKLKKEEMDRCRRQAEEEELQRMKDIQREKAIKLEMKTKQVEQQRRELYQHDHQTRTEEFLRSIERSSSVPVSASSSAPTSSWARSHEYREARRAEENAILQQGKEEQRKKSDLLEEKQRQREEERKRQLEMERRRVNSAFLDRLEAAGSGRVQEPLACSLEDSQSREPQDPGSSSEPNPTQVHTDTAEETDSEWVIMKLLSNFPSYDRDLLEDIVIQCNGNYQQAYELLQQWN